MRDKYKSYFEKYERAYKTALDQSYRKGLLDLLKMMHTASEEEMGVLYEIEEDTDLKTILNIVLAGDYIFGLLCLTSTLDLHYSCLGCLGLNLGLIVRYCILNSGWVLKYESAPRKVYKS